MTSVTPLPYSNPKPLRGELLVKVNPEAKNTHTIEGTDIKLYMAKDFGWNDREKNPVNAVVIHPGNSGLAEGDNIVCWHNSFEDSKLVHEEREGDEKTKYYIINKKHIFFLIDPQGEFVPYGDFFLADRIYNKPVTKSKLILLDSEGDKEQNRVLVKRVSPSCELFKEGDVVIIETMADYEVVFMWKEKEHRVIRIKERDVMAIDHSFKITKHMRLGV